MGLPIAQHAHELGLVLTPMKKFIHSRRQKYGTHEKPGKHGGRRTHRRHKLSPLGFFHIFLEFEVNYK
jgi:hypothetical protein